MVVCIAEDRQSEEIAVRLLILSLADHCPNLPIHLFFPLATEEFRDWLEPFSQVTLRTTRLEGASGWNVKPYALLTLLNEGYEEAWWLDSDIILSQDFRTAIDNLSPTTVVSTEEAAYGKYRDEGYRARAWGFELGRSLPFNLNSAVVRVTQAHVSLVQRWKDLVEREDYQQVQISSIKPFHMYGDQDVLTALLSSKEFSGFPLRVLKRGEDIIHYFGPAGYSTRERLINLQNGLPPFIHSQRDKPWLRQPTPPDRRNLRQYFDYVRLEVSPYSYVAARYQKAVGCPMAWLEPNSGMGKLLSLLGLGNPALKGLPLGLVYDLVRVYKTARGIDDRFNPEQEYLKLQSQGIV